MSFLVIAEIHNVWRRGRRRGRGTIGIKVVI